MLNTALRYFLEVVDAGSLTLAAQKLHVAPSAVSRMVRKLEGEHQAQLFERHARGMVLTEAGQLLKAYARRASLDAERARAEIRELSQIGQKLIRVSANQAFGRELLPRVIGEFREIEPTVRFELNILQSSEINRRVREGEDDIGLSYNLAPPQDVHVQYARRMPLFAVMAPQHPLAGRDMLSMQDIGDYPVVLMGPGSTNRFFIDLCCMHEKIELNIAMTCNNQGAIQTCCQQWGAISFSGDLTVMTPTERGELVSIPMANSELHQRIMHIQTMADRQLPASVGRFVQALASRINASYADPAWLAAGRGSGAL
ncbi:LysR family regulatory protein [Bordetella pertussis]|uniref:LysR family regulatory protein n=3 Tax=Bordetella pertussis TaxID=520 RepID=Q7VTQ2_BORPE|nr:LysR family transcriptional regulator [Bordetella pertussis]ETH41157.1 LysR substrate-binding domain protein [Bordetella pertussis H918]ETH43316.1 LysR substrate-binding domain protein [Bordetella pertussis H939]ETH49382.1 LysR substrate-binding domain protein [Bordetella pertussis H921]ETH70109.1 LysR substrate-binding domain protein [Bordetella pertussis STO1-CHLA-0011]ETH82183.1 LysR substrate-binding domain protein [Bordetella pertussis STO1-CHOC-0017]ETH85118.1 LysR substrate-binding 